MRAQGFLVQAMLLAAMAPVLTMDQRPAPLCFLVGDRVAFVATDTVDQSLLEAVRDLPVSTRLLVIGRNLGGFELPAVEIGEILRTRRMEAYVVSECDSACSSLFQGALFRTAERTAVFVVHSAQPGPDGNENIDAERRYDARKLVDWGLDPQFAETYVARDSGEKELSADEARAVGMVTLVVSNGRSEDAVADPQAVP